MSIAEDQIKAAHAKIATAKQQVAQAQGSLETYTASLKANHGISTLEEAEALKVSLASELEKNQAELTEVLESIQKIFSEAGV